MYIVEIAQKIPMTMQLKHLSKSQETSHIKADNWILAIKLIKFKYE